MPSVPLTASSFGDVIEQNDIVALDFWNNSCAPCRVFAPIFEAASDREPDVFFGTINTEAEQELAGAFGIRSVPTVAIYREGIMVYSRPGVPSRTELRRLIATIRDLDMQSIREKLAAS
ncbi:thioredoxin family protein [Salinibacterium hongtaonis]|uniref:thioredoxin family protein n=1 Tax=Homoserinimonas hongtaonis TaxID=2079791 RepID=UPI000D383F14|nr:thioredoxin family protein [Salinibacterium hongtaonis]AWB90076.1 thiol reductase thioredoxin [Salinibacterium hongtaonis]